MSQTIPITNVYEDVDVIQPSSDSAMFEIKKILYRLKWCEDNIKAGRNGSDRNLEYLTNRVRDLEGFLAVMDGERIREASRKYFDKRERESRHISHPLNHKLGTKAKKLKKREHPKAG